MTLAKGIAAVLSCGLLLASAAAQNAGYTPRTDDREIPSYELVSIRKTTEASLNPGIHDTPDGFMASAQSLRSLITEAYGFSLGQPSEQQLTGAPAWAKTQLFDVHAKVDPDNVTKLKEMSKASTMMVEVRQLVTRTPSFRMVMLQRVLEDRFHLKVHYEQKAMALYQMTVAKGGMRLKLAHPANPESGNFSMSDGKLDGENVPMAFIPMALGLALERPVEDKTGVSGNYDFQLRWQTAEQSTAAQNTAGSNESAPSLFTAVQEQMGLKLNAGKGPVWIVVVDHAELPSEN